MRTAELETAFREGLEQAGLVAALNEEKSQFLGFSDGFLAEIVLNDGSKLPGAERIVRRVKEEFEERGVQVDLIVRAVWRVKEINFIGPARALSGGLKAALEFDVILESGGRQCNVTVEVNLAALNALREKLALPEKVGFPGWDRNGDVDEETLRKAVAEYLGFRLSAGGTSYWDPILFPRIELEDATVSYLIPDSKAFRQLQAAIDRFFRASEMEDSLRTLNSQGVMARDFHRVLPELSNYLGGSFGPGESLATNASTLFQSLGEVERKRLEQHYLQKLSEIPEELKLKYAEIFSN